MSDESGEVMGDLKDLSPGMDVRLTVEDDGEELELDGHVTDAWYDEPEQLGFGWDSGELTVDVDLTDETVEEQDMATHSLDIRGTEKKPGEWKRVSIAVWDPVAEDGMVVEHDWTRLGTITGVEVLDDE